MPKKPVVSKKVEKDSDSEVESVPEKKSTTPVETKKVTAKKPVTRQGKVTATKATASQETKKEETKKDESKKEEVKKVEEKVEEKWTDKLSEGDDCEHEEVPSVEDSEASESDDDYSDYVDETKDAAVHYNSTDKPQTKPGKSAALSFSYKEALKVNTPVDETSTTDLLRVLIARSHDDGKHELKKVFETTLRGINLECALPDYRVSGYTTGKPRRPQNNKYNGGYNSARNEGYSNPRDGTAPRGRGGYSRGGGRGGQFNQSSRPYQPQQTRDFTHGGDDDVVQEFKPRGKRGGGGDVE